MFSLNSRFLAVTLLIITNTILVIFPAKAQLNLKQILQTTSTSTLTFSPNTVGSVISGAGDLVYLLDASKDQTLNITINSLGARASITIFAPNRQQIKTLTGFDETQEFEFQLPDSGTYYIFCYSGPTFHFYDFTIRVD